VRYRLHGDRARAAGIEALHEAEQVDGSFPQVAGLGKVEHRRSKLSTARPDRAEGEQRFARLDFLDIEPDPSLGRVVGSHHARRLDGGALIGALKLLAQSLLDLFRSQTARAQQMGFAILDLDDRRFEPDGAGAAIENEINLVAQISADGLRGRSADLARGVGAWSGNRMPKLADDLTDEAARHAHGERRESGRHERMNARSFAKGQNQRQRTRPELLG